MVDRAVKAFSLIYDEWEISFACELYIFEKKIDSINAIDDILRAS